MVARLHGFLRSEVGVARELRDGVSEIDHPTESSNPKIVTFLTKMDQNIAIIGHKSGTSNMGS